MVGSMLKPTVESMAMWVQLSSDPELTTTKAIRMVPLIDKVEKLLRVTELHDFCWVNFYGKLGELAKPSPFHGEDCWFKSSTS